MTDLKLWDDYGVTPFGMIIGGIIMFVSGTLFVVYFLT